MAVPLFTLLMYVRICMCGMYVRDVCAGCMCGDVCAGCMCRYRRSSNSKSSILRITEIIQ